MGSNHISVGGFSLVEIMITSALVLMLLIGAYGGLCISNRASRRQAEDSSALSLVQGKIEQIRGLSYDYPSIVFSNKSYSTSNTVSVAMDSSGSKTMVSAGLITTFAPYGTTSNNIGHLVTVSLTLTNAKVSRTVQLQTLVNEYTSTF